MRPITWLHLSDVHLRPEDQWPQRLVLDAMCADIARRRPASSPDFVLLSGDLAYSGQREQYEVVATFLDKLSQASGVPKAHIYCVPGNHDIDRDRQKMTFIGARARLTHPHEVDIVLGPSSREELATLLQREEDFRTFQRLYFTEQERTATEDGLAYVAHLTIEDVRLAIVGLDSAWLAEGGDEDHGKLLVGERQVDNALKLAHGGSEPPHVVLAMSHHPLQFLQQFDLRSVQARIERSCHFLHCGHLHTPEQRPTNADANGCVTLVSGSSFETRHTRNSYGVVTLDLLRAIRSVTTIQYDCHETAFTSSSTVTFPIALSPSGLCTVEALAGPISTCGVELASWPHYLAALLLDQKAEWPVPTGTDFVLASFDALEAGPPSDLKSSATAFRMFRNALRVLYSRVPLSRIFEVHGSAVAEYGARLATLAKRHSTLKGRLDQLESDARKLAPTEQPGPGSHAVAMLKQVAATGDWPLLREQAERHVDSRSQATALVAQRMLARALANSTEHADKARAASLYRQLTESDASEPIDFGNLAILCMDLDESKQAKDVILRGVAKHRRAGGYWVEIGHQVVAATGDREFRKRLAAAIGERGKA